MNNDQKLIEACKQAEQWRKLAGTRQGLINKLEKKISRLETELIIVMAKKDSK